MPLEILNFGGGWRKFDLEPLKGMSLKFLCVNCSRTDDLSPLQGMPLEKLLFKDSRVSGPLAA